MSNSCNYNDNKMIKLESELTTLKLQYNELKEQNDALHAHNRELISNLNALSNVEENHKQLLQTLANKDEKIESLIKEKNHLLKLKDKTVRELDMKYLKEFSFLKNQQEMNFQKVENANIAVKVNEKQHEHILELENNINEMLENEAKKMKEIKFQHENQFTMLKMKMMDHIRNSQKKVSQTSHNNLDLNTKLSKLTVNQLLIELENQSKQIEDLLKQKEKYEKDIFSLKTDLETHKKVEQVLQEKNKKYLEMVRACEKKMNNKSVEFPMRNEIKEQEIIPMSLNRNYEKLYKKLIKEYESLKGIYECLKDKERNYQIKFGGIINLFEMAIEDLVQDEEFINLKNVNVNMDEIGKGNFENFTKKEKYSILVFLMKNLLPLLNDEESERIQNLKNQFETVEIKTSGRSRNNFINITNSGCSNTGQMQKSNFFKKIYNNSMSKFPKIEHFMIDKKKGRKNSLYRFLTIK